ncbi:uncharacterized protein LY89DRAFT_4214 [Mollisia scopiformis]|uniref:Secreted protein n=1 Tax=Mollisia scopiformis TaxID=149040 RepID=A0A194XUX7_MOLSC|nr:uncharacterized protein LY89DRAFT_4214 [Mollisia scopiformis]KUJ23839.1 hypothetical protein LY89DRAFT_4214 [Mollisia scopiformis]
MFLRHSARWRSQRCFFLSFSLVWCLAQSLGMTTARGSRNGAAPFKRSREKSIYFSIWDFGEQVSLSSQQILGPRERAEQTAIGHTGKVCWISRLIWAWPWEHSTALYRFTAALQRDADRHLECLRLCCFRLWGDPGA